MIDVPVPPAMTHTDAVTGQVLEWRKETTNHVVDRTEAIAIMQRTIDFFLVKLRDAIAIQYSVSHDEAAGIAIDAFRKAMPITLAEPFPKAWLIALDDVRIEFTSPETRTLQ